MRSDLTIGKLAERAGVNVETIRYYQRRGLLDEPKKPLGGYRHYPPDMTKRVRFIRRAQALGFTLEEIAGLLQLEAASACVETRELAVQKLALIDQKLAELAAMRVRQKSPEKMAAAEELHSLLKWAAISRGIACRTTRAVSSRDAMAIAQELGSVVSDPNFAFQILRNENFHR